MGAVKVTISLPEDLADYADSLAADAKKPRSQVFASLLAEKRARALYEQLAEGYRYYAEENSRFAEEAMPMAAEIWDEYDFDFSIPTAEDRKAAKKRAANKK